MPIKVNHQFQMDKQNKVPLSKWIQLDQGYEQRSERHVTLNRNWHAVDERYSHNLNRGEKN